MIITPLHRYRQPTQGVGIHATQSPNSPTLRFGAVRYGDVIIVETEASVPQSEPPKPIAKLWQTNPTLAKLVGHVFRNAKFLLPARDHTSGVSALQKAEKAGVLKKDKPFTLINVDSHSDVYFSDDQEYSLAIANWVNQAILNYPAIREVYWVMPEEISANHAEKFSRKAGVPKYTSQTTIYVDRKKKATYVENVPEDYSEEDKKKLETVAFHQVTSDQLPNLKDKTVYLSIDMDYFSNTGYDTYKNTEVPCQGKIGIQKLFEAFKKSDVAPEIVNLSLSPEYSYTGNNNVRAISSLLRRGPVIETAVFLKKICRQIISKATGN